MKTKITTFAFIAFASITTQFNAQELTTKTKGNVTGLDDWETPVAKIATGQHIKKAVLTCRVIPSATGCVISFENDVKSPRDAASGLATGKRMHKPLYLNVSASDNSVTEIKSPRDAASGLPTGKRQHKPLTLIKEYHKSSPKLAEAVAKGRSSSDLPPSEIAIDEPGVHKVAMQDLHFTMTCGGKTTQIECIDGTCEIPIGTCPNGTCSAIASWSWGASNSGSTMSSSGSGRCAVDFLLEIEDGACTAMAINEKGLPGGSSKKSSK